jgi:hypothetical protein
MSRKVFTAGEVLAAADVNSFLMDQTVMSFAGTAARGSAIGTAVNGMTTYLEDSQTLQVHNGTSYSGVGGLTLITQQEIGTTVSSVVVANVFSAIYDNYLIQISGVTASAGGGSIDLTLNNSAGSTYRFAGAFQIYSGTQTNSASGAPLVASSVVGLGNANNTTGCIIQMRSPFLSVRTTWNAQFSGSEYVGFYSGFDDNAVSHTGFTITASTGTYTGGAIAVYGYRKV